MHIEQMEPRRLLSTTVAPGGDDVWGSGNYIEPHGHVINASSHDIYVYVTGKGWVTLEPGFHTPPGSDVNGWTFDPTKNEGPRDASGDPMMRNVQGGEYGKAKDTADGKGVEHDAGGSYGTTEEYPEVNSGSNPDNLAPGHNGTPDSDLPNHLDRGDAFDDWYDDPDKGLDDPNDPGYMPPRPEPETEEPDDEVNDQTVLP